MVRTMNVKRNVRMVEATGAASLVERVGFWACQLVWTAAVAGVLVLAVKVLAN
jgi:hypothetical protein